MRFTLLFLLGTVLLAGGSVARGEEDLREGESVVDLEWAPWSYYPGAVPLDAAGEDTYWCVRIVDAVDRRPIPGAIVSVPDHPGGGVPDAELHHLCAGIADPDGWVRLPWVAMRGWRDYVFADAPGYAATEYCDPGDEECALRRGTDVPVVVLDYVGRPVPHARIALNLACGHVPDQRTTVTDAEGRGVLRDIRPSRHEDVWVEAPHCHRGTTRLRRTWRPGDPPVAIDAVPGTTTSGRVLAADGTPVAHVYVGASGLHRPWSKTDLEGRYRLVGVSAWEELEFVPPADLGVAEGRFVAPPEGVERVLVLGASEARVAVRVRCVGAEAEAAAGVRVALVRSADGLTATRSTDEEGTAKLRVPAGTYRVLADGKLGTWGTAEAALEVEAGGSPSVEVDLPRNPTVRVDFSRVAYRTVGLTTPRGFRVLVPDEEDLQDVVVPVPAEGKAAFRVSDRVDGELVVSYVDVPPPGGSVTLEWAPVTRVTARLVGPDGEPVPGVLTLQRTRHLDDGDPERVEEEPADVEPWAESRLVGTVDWIAVPRDPALDGATGVVRLLEEGGTIHLGTLRLQRRVAPDVRVEFPSELLAGEQAYLSCRVPDVEGDVGADVLEDGTLAPEGSRGWPSLGAGTSIEVRVDGDPLVLPVRTVAGGPPPWRVAWPAATLTIAVRDEEGRALEKAVALVDGQSLGAAWRGGEAVVVRGVAAGWHTVIVAEPGHVGKRHRLRIEDGEARVLDVTLPVRGE